jgi:hypothetical protein
VWDKSEREDVASNRSSGTLVFKDYGTRTDIRRIPKTAHYLLGTYGAGRVRPAAPNIDVTVGTGTRPPLIVHNRGGAFRLVARARILRSCAPIDGGSFYEFSIREVSGSEGITSYTLATVSTTHARIGPVWVVKIHGELMAVVQRWEGPGEFWCEIEWVFFQESQSQLVPLHSQVVWLALSRDGPSLDAKIVRHKPTPPR